MYRVAMYRPTTFFLLFLSLALTSLAHAQPSMPEPPASGPAANSTNTRPVDPVTQMLNDGLQLLMQKQFSAALVKANAAIAAAPKNANAYELRATIYLVTKLWDHAAQDYQTALQFDPTNNQLKFNLADIEFMQKKYDTARPGFAALEHDMDMGDLASYKVFLCDLFGGHEAAAAKEFDLFNQAARNPSYYFANAAWDFYHQKPDDAHGWLASALDIYSPVKCRLYAVSLIDLGYMPIGPPPQK